MQIIPWRCQAEPDETLEGNVSYLSQPVFDSGHVKFDVLARPGLIQTYLNVIKMDFTTCFFTEDREALFSPASNEHRQGQNREKTIYFLGNSDHEKNVHS